jgi:hypothetical protein
MDKAIISGCLVAFALFALGACIHTRMGHLDAAARASADKTVEPSEIQPDHITTALRNLANGKFKL